MNLPASVIQRSSFLASCALRSVSYELAGGDGDRDAGPARQPECPDSPGKNPPHHIPVMPREVLSLLQPEQGGIYVDATVGLGGHAELILSASEQTRLIGIDRDAESLEMA